MRRLSGLPGRGRGIGAQTRVGRDHHDGIGTGESASKGGFMHRDRAFKRSAIGWLIGVTAAAVLVVPVAVAAGSSGAATSVSHSKIPNATVILGTTDIGRGAGRGRGEISVGAGARK